MRATNLIAAAGTTAALVNSQGGPQIPTSLSNLTRNGLETGGNNVPSLNSYGKCDRSAAPQLQPKHQTECPAKAIRDCGDGRTYSVSWPAPAHSNGPKLSASPRPRRGCRGVIRTPQYVRDSTCEETGFVDTSTKDGRCVDSQYFVDRRAERQRQEKRRDQRMVFAGAVGWTFALAAAAGTAYAGEASDRRQGGSQRRASSASQTSGRPQRE